MTLSLEPTLGLAFVKSVLEDTLHFFRIQYSRKERSRGSDSRSFARLVAALLATPYAFVYDMPIVATAVIWFVAERHRAGDALGTGEVAVLMLAMLAPITLAAVGPRFPLAVLSLILLLAAIVRRCRRLRSASARPGCPATVRG